SLPHRLRGRATTTHGIFRPADDQRHYAGLHLRPHRHRLHDGIRHHRHGELRPWRRLHALHLHRPHLPDGPDPGAGARLAGRRPLRGADPRHAAHLAVGVGDRAPRLPASARLFPTGPSHLGHRHVDLPVEPGAGDAGPAQQASSLHIGRGHHAERRRHLSRHALLQADHDRGGHGPAARGVLVRRAAHLARPRPARLRAGPAHGGAARRRRRQDHLAHLRHGSRAGRRRRAAVHDLLRRGELQRRLRPGREGLHGGRAGRYRLAAGRGAGRVAHRPHRDAVVRLLFHRLQGRRHLLDPRHHARVPAVGAPRQAGRGESVMSTAMDAAATRPMATAKLAAALKDALGTALLTLGLAVPILALRTEQNISNELILQPRWGYVAIAVALAFSARFLYLVAPAAPARPRMLSLPRGFGRVLSAVLLMVLLLYPLIALALTGKAGAVKWIDNFGIQILIYIMLGWGLNIVVGLAGLLDLGYVAFYAVGAYAYALLATSDPVKSFMADWIGAGFWPLWAFWICLPVAGLMAAFWGILLGFPVLRLRGDYLAIVTLAFGEIIRLVLINWVPVTNGYAGVSGIPRPSFFGIPFNASDEGFTAVFGLEFTPLYRTIFLFYLIVALALLTNWVTLRLRRLPIGRAWEALREDEIACRSLGINTTNTKLTAFAIGAGFGGFAGSFFAARQGFISPESFTFMESAVVLSIVVLGGMGSQIGVAIAALVMIGGTEILRELDWLKRIFGSDFDPTQY